MRGGEMTYTDKQIIKALEVRMPHDEVSREAYDLIQRQRAEVAREIFEEIEKFLEVALMNGHIETPILCIGFGTFFELKKKYTEEQK
jgi:hypothetical protein